MSWKKRVSLLFVLAVVCLLIWNVAIGQRRTEKPVLHGKHWAAITGKPMAATAGAMMFMKGGNAVDAACAMLGATCTMWDVLSWGGETQALIYNPHTKKVIGINALGVAPSGATPEFYKSRGYANFPPEYGPLSAVTPGTPGGLMVMLAEYGKLSLKDVLEPSMVMAAGYPVERDFVRRVERNKERIKKWPYTEAAMLTHAGEEHEAPHEGEVLRQPDLLETLKKIVAEEERALKAGKSRKEAIYAAYDRFYRGDIAEEFVRGCREQGGLITLEDMAEWKVYQEEPVTTTYKGIQVYKLTHWVQGPVMLQMLNMLENFDLQSMGFNSVNYIHTLYQVMNLCYADRDFYYGDPYFPPEEPIKGLLSKEYAKERLKSQNKNLNDPHVKPGDPYPFEGKSNPFLSLLEKWSNVGHMKKEEPGGMSFEEAFTAGTTSIQAADEEGWVISVTPSGGWVPAVIAGKTGIGMSQRAQSFVLNEALNPYNVIAPGKRPRATLTPGMALKDGRPYLSFAVQGGDTQDQNLLQFFLNMVEWGMNVQEACEGPNIVSYQMMSSFGDHEARPGRLTLNVSVPESVRENLRMMGYDVNVSRYTSGPINAIFFDWDNGSFWGGSSNHGDDYGVIW
jgi:gamma-glutamyltranspeptidase/glutathione hydrolase